MSHFRVENARFRILKGGKIGLSLSIALASSLILYPVDGNATDYFTDVDVTLINPKYTTNGTSVDGNTPYSLTVEQATNDTNKTSAIRKTTDNDYDENDDIIINPTSWASSSYNNPIFKPEINDIDNPSNNKPDRFEVTKTQNNDLNLTLTFDTDANANNISKSTDDVTFYSVEDGTTGIKKASDVTGTGTTLNLNQNSSKDYTTTIAMSGNNTIAGTVVLGAQDSIKLNGAGIVFGDTVDAGDIIVNSNGASATFKNRVTVENGLKYEQDGIVNLEGGLVGDVVGSNSVGILNISGDSAQDIKGNIGSIGNLNISTGENATITGDINATNTNITTGSTLNISDGKTITSTIKSSDKTGNLTLLGSGIVNGTVGDITNSLNSVNVGVTGSDSTFKNSVYSNTIDSTGIGRTEFQNIVNTENLNVNSGNMTFKDTLNATNTTIGSGSLDLENGADLKGTTVDFTNTNAELNLSDGSDITVTNGITSTNGNNGKINIAGNSTIYGNIGTTTNKISEININGSNTQNVILNNSVNVDNLNVKNGNLTLENTTTANNTTIDNGKINIENIFNGNITGSNPTQGEVNFNSTGNQNYSGEITNLKDVNVNSSLTVNGKIESANTNIKNDNTLTLNNSTVTSNIKTDTNGSGTLNLTGTNIITGDIGETNKKLNTVEALADSNTTINDNIFSNDIKLNSNSIINSSGNITANINGSTNTGTLNMIGANSVITGNVYDIEEFKISSGITTLNGNLNTQNTNINSNSTLILDNSTVNSSIKTDANGNLKLDRNNSITGDIGESNKKLNTLEALNGSTTTINDNIFANDITLNSNSTINSSGNITANIDGSANNSGTLNMSGASLNPQIITGNIGNTNAIKDFKINSGTTTLNGNLNAQNTTIVQDAILNSKGDLKSNIQGDGILKLSKDGTQTVTGNINTQYTKVEEDTTLKLSNNSNIDSLLSGDGTLDIVGNSTIKKEVGSSIDKFGEIKTTTSSSNATFNDNVFVNSVNVEKGEMNFQSNLNSTNTNIGDGKLNLNNGSTITADEIKFTHSNAELNLNNGSDVDVNNIVTSSNNKGKINITGSGTSIISGTIGTDDFRLEEIKSNAQNVVINDEVFVKDVSINSGNMTFESTLNANDMNIGSGTGTFNTLNSNLNFTGNGTADLNDGINGEIDFAGNDGTVNLNSGDITHDVKTTGTSGTLNIAGVANVTAEIGIDESKRLKNINSVDEQTDVVFSEDVFAQNVNINNGNMKFEKELNADNVSIENGLGSFNKLDSNIVFNGNGTALLNDGINGDITTTRNDQGILSLVGTKNQIIDGNIGEIDKKIKEFNINGGQIATVDGSINATDTNINNSSTLQLGDNQSINSTIKGDGTGILELLGSSTINQVIANLGDLKINADGSNSIFEKSVNSQNITSTGNGESEFKANITTENLNVNSGKITLKDISSATNTHIDLGTLNIEKELNGESIVFNDDGVLNLSDNANLNVENISSIDENKGTLNILENADIYSNINKINSINILGDEDKVVNFKNGIFSNLTSINSATVNFNQNSGNTKTNLLFLDNAVANLNGDLIGSINFQDTDAVVNVKDGKSIIGSVNSNINGTINYEGGGSLGKTIDENDSGNIVLGTLNVNTKNHQNKGGEIVPDDGLYIHRDIYADRINLQNNATLVLDNADLYALNDDKILIETDQDGQGDVIFNSSSIVNAQLAQNDKKLSSINAGNNGDKVVFNEDIFADRLNFLGDGNIVLNKEFDSLVDFKNKSGKLELADGINISEDGISFENANNATLKLNGDSTISRVLGDKNSGTSTFKNIEAGNSGKAVSFLEDIYIKDKLDIIGNGVVNLDGNLYSNLNFSEDGIVNIADGKSISKAITTNTDGKGNIIFEGETELNNNIGTKDYLLRNVVFGSLKEGDFNQKIDKDIYAQNTIIGNGENSSKISFDNNTKFGGNVYINNNSNLNINDNKIDIDGELVLGENSQLNYKVHTDDLKGNAQESGNSGKITADSLALDKDTKFHIDYDGTWEGKGQYNLIETNNDILTNYIGNEKNGLVSDNSIIDSVIISDGTNLVLKADRTGGDDYRPEDLYIVKSEIGNDYSNGASQSLAGYANGNKREDALADIIRDLEYLEGGITITDEKKAQMIDIQRKLAPKANNATVQSAMNVSKVSNEMVSSRIADIRRDIFEDRLAYAVDNSPTFTGYSSGDNYYYDVGDSTLWIKASYAKATQDAVKSYDGYKTKSYGATAGIDKVVGDDVIFGISASYFDTKVTQNRGDDDTKSYRGTIYGSSEFGLAYVDANVSFAHHETDSSREANSGKLSSKIKAQELSARVETGLNLPIDDGSYITPYVAVEHSIYKQKAYQEKGSKYQNDALKVDAVNLNTTSSEIGAKLTGRIELENALIIPHLRASVTNNFNHKNKDVKAQFVGGGSKFSTPHQDLHKTIYSVGTGIEARITNNSSIILDATYDRSKDGKYRAYGANVSFGLSF